MDFSVWVQMWVGKGGLNEIHFLLIRQHEAEGVGKDGLGKAKSRSVGMSTIDYVHQQFFPALGLTFNSKIIDPMKSL
jgi:hypothetical protein